ncbi:MAG: hypothetical protein N3I35_16285 [Clostridia bacterium]|nr:hypothetical protein [Clostridia bacterium]
MKRNILFLRILLPVMIILCFTATGCSGQKKQNPETKMQSLENEEKSEKVPDQLTSLEDNIEKIFKEFKGPATVMEEKKGGGKDEQETDKKQSQDQEGGQQGEGGQENKEQGGGTDEKGGQQGGGEKENQDKQQAQAGQQVKQPKQDPWTNVAPVINELHYQWDNYMPMAAQKGASKNLMDGFSKALNSLTNTIIGKNSTNTLMAASYLYAYIPDFYSLYKTEMSPEIKRIKYYTRNAMLNSWTANWTQAESDINALKSSWPLIKNTVSKDQQENCNKLDYSLYELEKVIKEKNQPLVDIKGRVALTNVQAIEKGMQKGNEKGGGSEGGNQGGGESGGESGGGQSGSGS